MMENIRGSSRKICLLSYFLFAFLIIHPLGVVADQADDNKSVLDGFETPAGQVPKEEIDQSEEPIGAEDNSTEAEVDDFMEDQSLFGMFIQSFLALAVVIVMIYVLIRFIGKRSQSYQANRTLQSIGGVHIGTNRSIQLVRVGERVLVVGVGEQVQLLKEIDNPDEVTAILKENEQQEGQQISSLFNKIKTKFIDQKNETDQSKVHFKKLLERQLKDVKHAQREAHAAIKEKDQQ